MGTELMIRPEVTFSADANSQVYFIRSAEWAWSLIGWLTRDSEHATDAAITTARDAMIRNHAWAMDALKIEAEEAIEKGIRRGVIYPEDFVKVARFPEIERRLWEEVEAAADFSDPHKHEHDYEPRMELREAAEQLRDVLDRLEFLDFDFEMLTDGSIRVKYSDDPPLALGYRVYREIHGWEKEAE